MIWPDVVNGSYEILGSVMMFWNCRCLYKDKQVKGVSVLAAAFFTSWSFWNLYYYPSLGQWMSFLGALIFVFVNASWVTMAIYYTQRNRSVIKH
ncbi:MAG: hypothetical protein AAB884_01280 [Patescibacteria group bacterium]